MADINWNPPATLYIYNGDLYCQPCGRALVEQFNDALDKDVHGTLRPLTPWDYEDSNSWPQEYSRGEGESDTPDHCSASISIVGDDGLTRFSTCQRFLGRRLTDDGIEYVKQSVFHDLDQYGAIGPVVEGWLDFYGIDLESIDGYYGVDGIDLASAVGIESETEGK